MSPEAGLSHPDDGGEPDDRPILFRVTEGRPQGAVAAHGHAGNHRLLPLFRDVEPVFQNAGQLFRQISAIPMAVDSVHIAAPAAIGHYHDDIAVLQIIFQTGQAQPTGVVLTMTVEQIQNRIRLSFPGGAGHTPALRQQNSGLGIHCQLIRVKIEIYDRHQTFLLYQLVNLYPARLRRAVPAAGQSGQSAPPRRRSRQQCPW